LYRAIRALAGILRSRAWKVGGPVPDSRRFVLAYPEIDRPADDVGRAGQVADQAGALVRNQGKVVGVNLTTSK
jgi:hypothetical protein